MSLSLGRNKGEHTLAADVYVSCAVGSGSSDHESREPELLRCFEAFDVNGNGVVDVSELLLLGANPPLCRGSAE